MGGKSIGHDTSNLQNSAQSDDHWILSSLTPRRAFVVWFCIGTAAAALLQFAQARTMGGVPEGLLFVGALEPVHEVVLTQLPNAPMSSGLGHDGQIFYAMALDLGGVTVPDVMGSAAYRYRRILFPAVASGLGVLDGEALLWGMIVVTALSVGLASGSVGALMPKFGLPAWAPLLVLVNPGMWLSARLLTSDALAFGLALLAVVSFVNRRYRWTVMCLALAALSKETYLAFALGLAGYAWFAGDRKHASLLAFGAAAPVAAWWTYIALNLGNPLTSGSTVVPPLLGVLGASRTWTTLAPRDLFYLVTTGLGIAAASWLLIRRRHLWTWLVAPWLLIAVVASTAVWQFGNNAIRVFAPILTLGILGLLAPSLDRRSHELLRTGEVG